MSFGGKFHGKKGGRWNEQRTIVPKENRTSSDGIVHRTRAECKRWDQLRLLQGAGHIRNLRREVRYKLEREIVSGHCDDYIEILAIKSRKGNVRTYTADFVYETSFQDATSKEYGRGIYTPGLAGDGLYGKFAWYEIIEDIKGFLEPAQELRLDVFEALYRVRVFINKV